MKKGSAKQRVSLRFGVEIIEREGNGEIFGKMGFRQ
jgi:hypothetical protein